MRVGQEGGVVDLSLEDEPLLDAHELRKHVGVAGSP